MVGIIWATRKADTRPLAPNKLAMTVSRARPKIRLITLPAAITAAARAMLAAGVAEGSVTGEEAKDVSTWGPISRQSGACVGALFQLPAPPGWFPFRAATAPAVRACLKLSAPPPN